MRYILDASVAIKWYVEGTEHPNANLVLKKLLKEPELFAVPELFTYEILSVLYRLHPEAQGIYSQDINSILHSGILRYPMTENIYTRADRFIKMGLIGYDAVYVALAEELHGVWLTFDARAHKKIASEKLSLNLFETEFLV
ncbi:MAG: type II toxin-antitoxin system VapC family toxin [Cyclobacteriaceae bacterium]|nr:type II toxin-antitoxin system VapC family toxin [Cyclobacteriaceae bacterium]